MSEKKVSTAAYAPFKTFLTVLDHLKAHEVPSIIDRSMFPTYSGTLQGQIIGTLQFLGLINEDGVPSEELHKLVAADTEERKTLLKPLLEKKYSNLFNVGLTKITPSQFESLFSTENYGVGGDTRKKARAFLFFALDYAGIPYSKLLKQRTRSPRRKGANNLANGNDTQQKEKPISEEPKEAKADDAIHGQAIKAIELVDSKKTVWIGTDANMFEIKRGKDLDFVLKLIELFDEYENSFKAKEPTEETFVAEAEN